MVQLYKVQVYTVHKLYTNVYTYVDTVYTYSIYIRKYKYSRYTKYNKYTYTCVNTVYTNVYTYVDTVYTYVNTNTVNTLNTRNRTLTRSTLRALRFACNKFASDTRIQ